MATVEMFLEEKERGLYRVEIEVGFPMLRRKEFFASSADEALVMARQTFLEFGVDDRASVQMMRPALQADIDRAQEAQEAAGDVTLSDAMALGQQIAHNTPSAATLDMIETDPGFVRRGPGRPRKEA